MEERLVPLAKPFASVPLRDGQNMARHTRRHCPMSLQAPTAQWCPPTSPIPLPQRQLSIPLSLSPEANTTRVNEPLPLSSPPSHVPLQKTAASPDITHHVALNGLPHSPEPRSSGDAHMETYVDDAKHCFCLLPTPAHATSLHTTMGILQCTLNNNIISLHCKEICYHPYTWKDINEW